MFGLEGSGFIVAVAVTLLIAGAIVYYCNTRITSMEKAIVKQNQVLADFIGNVKLSLTNAPMYGGGATNYSVDNGATQEAVQAANDYYSHTTPDDKINVSEDSQSEDDSDSESESESDDAIVKQPSEEVAQEEDIVELDTQNMESVDNSLKLEVVGITLNPPNSPPPPNLEPEIIEEIIEEDKSNNTKTITLGQVKDVKELELATGSSSELSSIDSDSNDEDDVEEDGVTVSSSIMDNITIENVSKLKVAKLRELAVKMNLGAEDSVKKIKKNALQDMIKNKIKETDE